VKWIDQVLEVALERMPQPLPDDEGVVKPTVAPAETTAPAAATLDALPH